MIDWLLVGSLHTHTHTLNSHVLTHWLDRPGDAGRLVRIIQSQHWLITNIWDWYIFAVNMKNEKWMMRKCYHGSTNQASLWAGHRVRGSGSEPEQHVYRWSHSFDGMMRKYDEKMLNFSTNARTTQDVQNILLHPDKEYVFIVLIQQLYDVRLRSWCVFKEPVCHRTSPERLRGPRLEGLRE